MQKVSRFPNSIEVPSTPTKSATEGCLYSQVFFKTKTSQDIKQIAASMTIAKIAHQTTVQIVTSFGAIGSGVIINKQEHCYTVLTANYLVENADEQYIISTHKGKKYPAMRVNYLASAENISNLALVQFSTLDEYSIAILNQTNQNFSGSDVYISGYLDLDSEHQEFKFLKGIIINCCREKNLPSSRVVYRGMSGSPVFNAKAEVVGIYLTIADKNSKFGVKTHVFVPLFSDSIKNEQRA